MRAEDLNILAPIAFEKALRVSALAVIVLSGILAASLSFHFFRM